MGSQTNQSAGPEDKKLPPLFLERLEAVIPESRYQAVVRTFFEPLPVSFRLHRPGITWEAVEARLRNAGLEAERVTWFEGAYILRRGGLRDLQATGLDREGWIYIQELSSMMVPRVLDPKPGERILDMAAAPGSKTTQIAMMMRGEGELVANDNHRSRFFKLVHQVRLQGFPHVKTRLSAGESFGRKYPESFDRVLVDAPCSSEGRFHAGDPATYRYWKPAKIREMAGKQKMLLGSALATVRSGGVVVYSTCTFAPEENEAVLDWALGKFPGLMDLEEPQLPEGVWMEGLTSWGKTTMDPRVSLTRRILPGSERRGFFIARIRKLRGVPNA